jgi:hypothetical protein
MPPGGKYPDRRDEEARRQPRKAPPGREKKKKHSGKKQGLKQALPPEALWKRRSNNKQNKGNKGSTTLLEARRAQRGLMYLLYDVMTEGLYLKPPSGKHNAWQGYMYHSTHNHMVRPPNKWKSVLEASGFNEMNILTDDDDAFEAYLCVSSTLKLRIRSSGAWLLQGSFQHLRQKSKLAAITAHQVALFMVALDQTEPQMVNAMKESMDERKTRDQKLRRVAQEEKRPTDVAKEPSGGSHLSDQDMNDDDNLESYDEVSEASEQFSDDEEEKKQSTGKKRTDEEVTMLYFSESEVENEPNDRSKGPRAGKIVRKSQTAGGRGELTAASRSRSGVMAPQTLKSTERKLEVTPVKSAKRKSKPRSASKRGKYQSPAWLAKRKANMEDTRERFSKDGAARIDVAELIYTFVNHLRYVANTMSLIKDSENGDDETYGMEVITGDWNIALAGASLRAMQASALRPEAKRGETDLEKIEKSKKNLKGVDDAEHNLLKVMRKEHDEVRKFRGELPYTGADKDLVMKKQTNEFAFITGLVDDAFEGPLFDPNPICDAILDFAATFSTKPPATARLEVVSDKVTKKAEESPSSHSMMTRRSVQPKKEEIEPKDNEALTLGMATQRQIKDMQNETKETMKQWRTFSIRQEPMEKIAPLLTADFLMKEKLLLKRSVSPSRGLHPRDRSPRHREREGRDKTHQRDLNNHGNYRDDDRDPPRKTKKTKRSRSREKRRPSPAKRPKRSRSPRRKPAPAKERRERKPSTVEEFASTVVDKWTTLQVTLKPKTKHSGEQVAAMLKDFETSIHHIKRERDPLKWDRLKEAWADLMGGTGQRISLAVVKIMEHHGFIWKNTKPALRSRDGDLIQKWIWMLGAMDDTLMPFMSTWATPSLKAALTIFQNLLRIPSYALDKLMVKPRVINIKRNLELHILEKDAHKMGARKFASEEKPGKPRLRLERPSPPPKNGKGEKKSKGEVEVEAADSDKEKSDASARDIRDVSFDEVNPMDETDEEEEKKANSMEDNADVVEGQGGEE